jgi:hypothetical protein
MTAGLRWFAGFGMVLVIAACSAAGQPSSASTSAVPATAVVSAGQPSTSASPTTASPTAQASGTRHVVGQVVGGGTLPGYTVEVPGGWSTADAHFVTKDGPGVVIGLGVWDVGQVATDPCHWKGHLVDPGPTVDDLVRALVAQSTRQATTPTDVTLAGQTGKYLEWSVPTGMVVTGDSDFKGCDTQDNGHEDFVSWTGALGGERYQQVAGQVDQLWVLDVGGQRLVVDATHSPNATAAGQAELADLVASIHFELP